MKRNEKGQFVKGEMPESGVRIDKETAREYQQRSVQSRKERKTIAETLRNALEEKISKDSQMTKREYLILKALSNASKDESLSFREISELQKILGESVQNVNVKGVAPIVAKDAEDAKAIQELFDSIEGRRNDR
jgi:L-lactate utilization protein LutB